MKPEQKKQSRREFIEGAAALSVIGAIGAGHILSSCSEKKERYEAPVFLDSAPDGPLLKAGLLGCGGRGTGAAVDFVNAGPNLQVTALGDVFTDRIDRCRNALKEQVNMDISEKNCFTGFDAYKRVIDSGVDVIICAAPPAFRPMHFEAAIQARKHCFIEKPAGVDPWGAKSIMASARMAGAAGLSVVGGTGNRHSESAAETFAQVKNGTMGTLIAANCIRMSGMGWQYKRPPGITDMEAMLRNWQNWTWLSGDMLVEMFIHHIDTFNRFFEGFPTQAIGFGGRHRRNSGDQYDFFSVNYAYDDGKWYQAMHRQINGCHNSHTGVRVFGTKGYTNCSGSIWDYDHNLVWEFRPPLDNEGEPIRRRGYGHTILVNAIRTNTPVNEATNMASSTISAVMGRESAYTGQLVTWDDMMNSSQRLGPAEYKWGPVDIREEPPVPGT